MPNQAFETTRRRLIAPTSIGGLLMATACSSAPRVAEASGLTTVEQANVALVGDFLASIRPRDMTNLARYLSPDCIYRMTETSPPDKGYEAMKERLHPFVDFADKIEIKILTTHAAGPIVINHRIDTFTSSTHPLLFEGVGVFFLADGKIKEWTDYTVRAALANEWPA